MGRFESPSFHEFEGSSFHEGSRKESDDDPHTVRAWAIGTVILLMVVGCFLALFISTVGAGEWAIDSTRHLFGP